MKTLLSGSDRPPCINQAPPESCPLQVTVSCSLVGSPDLVQNDQSFLFRLHNNNI